MVENELLLHNAAVHMSSALEEFVYYQKFTTSIKDAQTGRYSAMNQPMADRVGIPLNEYIGMTIYDVAKIINQQESVVKKAVDMDNRIFTGTLSYVKYQHIIPNYKRLLSIEEVIKKPVLGQNKNIIGVLGCGRDITHHVDPLRLFSLYQQYYPRKEAIQNFLRSMKLDHVFHTLPTKRELIVLLAMRKTSNAKYVARELSLSPRTIEQNKAHLCENLKTIRLNELLMRIRVRHELSSSKEEY